MPAAIMDAGFYLRNPQGKRRKVFDDNGKPRWEKIPSSAGRRRDRSMLREDGHIVYQTLTSHSANLDLESSQANFYRKKSKKLNWIPAAECPVVLAMSHQIDSKSLCKAVQDALAANEGCQSGSYSEKEPCKHFRAEEAARKGRTAEVEKKRTEAHKGMQEKLLEAQRQTQSDIAGAMNRMSDATVKSAPTKDKTSK